MLDAGRKLAVVVVSTALYLGLLYYVVGYAFPAVPGPKVLEPLFGSYRTAALTWVQLVHTLAVLVAAIPVAVLIRYAAGRDAFGVALLVGVLCAGVDPVLSMLSGSAHGHRSTIALVFSLVDGLKIALAVAGVLWLLNRLPSNNALEQTRER